MTLIRWSPIRRPATDLATVHDEVSRLFDSVFDRPMTWSGSRELPFTPQVDVEETEDAFYVRMDLPGVPQKDVKVTLAGEMLTIRGERRLESREGETRMHRTERLAGTFERRFELTTPVRAEQVTATYRDGVLEVRVPKAEDAKVREIEVQAG